MNANPFRFDPQPSRRPAFTLIELLVTLGVIALLAAVLLPVLSRAKVRADNVSCLSHLRQLGIAARLYAEDNNSMLPSAERLPSNPVNPQKPLARISDTLAPYVGRTVGTNSGLTVFKCPRDNDWFFEVEGSSYEWNTLLNGHRIDLGENQRGQFIAVSNGVVIQETNFNATLGVESTPIFWDYDNFHPRPKSGKNAVYMDGHAAIFEPPPLP